MEKERKKKKRIYIFYLSLTNLVSVSLQSQNFFEMPFQNNAYITRDTEYSFRCSVNTISQNQTVIV